MKYPNSLLIAFLFFVSCTHSNSSGENPTPTTPKVLQEKSLLRSVYPGNSNLVEELYTELAKQNPTLQQLNDDIELSQSTYQQLLEDRNAYLNKMENYYQSAKQLCSAFEDQELKKQIEVLLQSSKAIQEEKQKKVHQLMKEMERKQTKLLNHQDALKISLSLKLMEEYLKTIRPDISEIQTQLDVQNKLTAKADSLRLAK